MRQKIGCSLKVVACCRQLLVIQCIMDYWFYITVDNLYKQLYKFHDFTIIFRDSP